MNKAFVLLAMIFCHIVDDYYLQGWLASAKQKEWWKENAPQRMYRYDYIMALLMHGLSWSFMILLPVAVYSELNVSLAFVLMFILNAFLHCNIDNEKANEKTINLIADQILHLLQIVGAWLVLVL